LEIAIYRYTAEQLVRDCNVTMSKCSRKTACC